MPQRLPPDEVAARAAHVFADTAALARIIRDCPVCARYRITAGDPEAITFDLTAPLPRR